MEGLLSTGPTLSSLQANVVKYLSSTGLIIYSPQDSHCKPTAYSTDYSIVCLCTVFMVFSHTWKMSWTLPIHPQKLFDLFNVFVEHKLFTVSKYYCGQYCLFVQYSLCSSFVVCMDHCVEHSLCTVFLVYSNYFVHNSLYQYSLGTIPIVRIICCDKYPLHCAMNEFSTLCIVYSIYCAHYSLCTKPILTNLHCIQYSLCS